MNLQVGVLEIVENEGKDHVFYFQLFDADLDEYVVSSNGLICFILE